MSVVSVWARPFGRQETDQFFDSLVRRAFGPTVPLRRAFGPTEPLRRAFGPTEPLRAVSTGFTPAAEANRDGEDAVVRVELPGVDVANDVTVEVDRGRLVIRGERRDERGEQAQGRTVREVRYGSFRRSFSLPAHVSAEAISASYDAGVLSVRVAGAYAGSQAHRIPVTAGAASAPVVEAGADSAE